MNQSQITTIQRTIAQRIEAIATARYPNASDNIDSTSEITKALVHGLSVKMRPYAEIRRVALDKIARGGFSSERCFRFDEIFEPSAQIAAARASAAAVDRKRDKFKLKLSALQTRVVADCKLGKYDSEAAAALDEFEAKAEQISA